MLLTLNIGPDMSFHATAASIGLADDAAQAMRARLLGDEGTDFVWDQVKQAGARLMHVQPQGHC